MARVLVEHLAGKRRGERQELAGDRIRFGRHPDNEVAFDPFADLDASTWHAELRKEDGGWVVVDLNSSNGTFVDGKSGPRVPIRAGGRHKLQFGKGGPECALTIVDAAIPDTRGSSSEPRLMGPDTVAGIVRQAVQNAESRTSRRMALAVAGVSIVMIGVLAVILIRDARKKPIASAPPPPPPEDPGPRIAATNEHAVYLIAYADAAGKDPNDKALCTAFAVRPDLLATNAHCVDRIQRGPSEKQRFYAAQNKGDERHDIIASWRADGYRGEGGLSTDVGLVQVSPPMSQTVVLASKDRLAGLVTGTRVYLLGFPAVVASPGSPVASFLDGTIGRVTNFGGNIDPDSGNNLVVQHNAATSPGVSGSPIFDSRGEVVAINVGQTREVYPSGVDPATGMKQEPPAGVTPGVNIAIRIDALFPLLQKHGGNQ
jgi:V8-like Glu-specific endopeptidase